MSQSCPQHGALRAAPGVLHSKGQVSFWMGKFVYLGALYHPTSSLLCSINLFSAISIFSWWDHKSVAAFAFPARLSGG